MNLILVEDTDIIEENVTRLEGRRFLHIRDVQRAMVGDELRVGRLGGLMGTGRIVQMTDRSLDLELNLTEKPPAKLGLTLYLALPRPKFLKRVLQAVSSLGVAQIHLINSARTEKVYWSCDQLRPSSIRDALILGLEQARDTILPTVTVHRLFKPFVEDELRALVADTAAYVAHPGASFACPRGVSGRISLAIGPEGGFVPFEIQKLSEVGFEPVELGPRILKVETAVTSLIARLT